MNNYYGFVFKVIFPNGMIYVGQTTKRQHIQYFGTGGKDYQKLIKECEKENLIRHVLAFCGNSFVLNKMEEYFIKKLQSNITGYNIMYSHTNHVKGDKNPMNIDSVKKKMIESKVRYFKTNDGINLLHRFSMSERKYPLYQFINNGVNTVKIGVNEDIPIDWVKGQIHSEEFRKRSSEFMKQLWKNGLAHKGCSKQTRENARKRNKMRRKHPSVNKKEIIEK
jgi:hypothetical protein